MARVSIEALSSAVEIDLWAKKGGAMFKTRPLTRSLQRQLDTFMEEIEKTEDEEDAAIKLFGKFFDLLAMPVGRSQKKPSTVIEQKWKADELELGQLFALANAVTEALGAPPQAATKT